MANVPKIIRVINLLFDRKSVSVDTISKTCKVSRRTAYRYINYISKSGIPVTYDRALHGYRLESQHQLEGVPLNIDDTILITIALALLSRKANGYYRQDTDLLLRKILSSQKMPLTELWQAFEQRFDTESDSRDISDLITTLIVHSAAMFNQKVNISLADHSNNTREVEIENPALCFRDTWRLSARETEQQGDISFSQIKRARIV